MDGKDVENVGCGVERGKRGLTEAVVLRGAFSMGMPEKGKLLLRFTPIRTGEGLKSSRGCFRLQIELLYQHYGGVWRTAGAWHQVGDTVDCILLGLQDRCFPTHGSLQFISRADKQFDVSRPANQCRKPDPFTCGLGRPAKLLYGYQIHLI